MTSSRAFAVLLLSLLFFSCQQVVENPEDTISVERLVVYGILRADQPVDSILLTKTLPLLVEYSPAAAAVTDASASISVNGTSYPLHSIGGGYYAPTGLMARAGSVYTLDVLWNGETSQASTIVPLPAFVHAVKKIATVDSSMRGQGYPDLFGVDIDVEILPQLFEVYLLSQIALTGDPFSWRLHSHPRRPRDTSADGRIHLSYNYYFGYDSSAIRSVSGTLRIVTYDFPYYDYFITRPSNGEDDGPGFSGSPRNVRWNVRGAGIGMFLGEAEELVKF